MEFDLEADLWQQSEFEKSNADRPPTLPTRKGRASIFDVTTEEEELMKETNTQEDKYKTVMVRGRPIRMLKDERPGISDLENKTRAALREVCPLGYSDDLIKSYLRQNQTKNPETSSSSSQKKENYSVQYEEQTFADAHPPKISVQLKSKKDFPPLK